MINFCIIINGQQQLGLWSLNKAGPRNFHMWFLLFSSSIESHLPLPLSTLLRPLEKNYAVEYMRSEKSRLEMGRVVSLAQIRWKKLRYALLSILYSENRFQSIDTLRIEKPSRVWVKHCVIIKSRFTDYMQEPLWCFWVFLFPTTESSHSTCCEPKCIRFCD